MRKRVLLVVAVLFVGLFVGTFQRSVASVNGVGSFIGGYAAKVGTLNNGTYCNYNNVSLTVPEGYQAEIVSVSGYFNGVGDVHLAIYDSNHVLLRYSSNMSVTDEGWKSWNVSGLYLLSGTYHLAVGKSNSTVGVYCSTATGMPIFANYSSGYGFDTAPTLLSWANDVMSLYWTYDLVPLVSLSQVSVDSTTIGQLALTLFLVGLSVVLALKSRSWAVNFLFGLSLVGFLGWQFANATVEVYGGWLEFMVLVGAVLVLVKGAVLVRASGV